VHSHSLMSLAATIQQIAELVKIAEHLTFLCNLISRQLPRSTLFPYTTLFRSRSSRALPAGRGAATRCASPPTVRTSSVSTSVPRSEEHTFELQSRGQLVCRLLLEKKKKLLRI